jgi:Plant transposon protein
MLDYRYRRIFPSVAVPSLTLLTAHSPHGAFKSVTACFFFFLCTMDDSLDDELQAYIFAPVAGLTAADAEDELLLDNAAVLVAEMMLVDDSEEASWGGSKTGKAPNKDRNFQEYYERMVKNYFSGVHSVYDEGDFERRHRVPRPVFDRVWQQLHGQGTFVHRQNAMGELGIHPLLKVVACFRKLAYGNADDQLDEVLGIAESTMNATMKEFVQTIKRDFSQYLHRCPTPQEISRAQAIYAARGFPGCFASWDCKHFQWKNCPIAQAGQHRGKEGKSTLVLEAICDGELYIWHSFFGEAGSLNDINILDKSSIVHSLLNGSFSLKSAPYKIHHTVRDWLYFLVQRYHILARPLRNFYWDDIVDLLDCCVILHNMAVEHRRSQFVIGLHEYAPVDEFGADQVPDVTLFGGQEQLLAAAPNLLQPAEIRSLRMAALSQNMKNAVEHHSLKADLVEHVWARNHGTGADDQDT